MEKSSVLLCIHTSAAGYHALFLLTRAFHLDYHQYLIILSFVYILYYNGTQFILYYQWTLYLA